MKEHFKHNIPTFLRAAFLLIALYVIVFSAFWAADMFKANIFSNDQCVWSPEKINGKSKLVFRSILKNGVSDRAGIVEGDILTAVNGIRFSNEFEAQKILNDFSPSDTVYYTIVRGSTEIILPLNIVKTYSTIHVAFAFIGFSLWLIGLIVILSRPRDKIPVLFYWMAMSGTFLFLLGGGLIGSRAETSTIVYLHALIAFTFFPALFYHFFITFPAVKYYGIKRRMIVTGIYLLFIANTGFGLYTHYRYGNFSGLTIFVLFTSMGFAFGSFCKSYFSITNPELRKPLRSILIGTAIGLSGFIYMLLITMFVPFLFINHPELLFPVAVVALIPLSFGYSIFRYRLMDIEIIIKKSMVYTATTVTLGLCYIGILMILNAMIRSAWSGMPDDRIVHTGSLIMAALIFMPVKNYFQGVVDKKFFRDRYNYQKALLEFSKELPGLSGLEQIVQQVIASVRKTMHIESVSLVLFNNGEESGVFHNDGSLPESCLKLAELEQLILLLQKSQNAQLLYEVALQELPLPDNEKSLIRSCRIVAAVPMIKSGRLSGALFLGPKQSERTFSSEDIDLLLTVANQTAIAIENALLMKREIDRTRYENELQVARRIQQSLLPQEQPLIDSLDIAGIAIPAYSVGGDYFDYVRLDEHRLLISIGDVSGKGVSAALYMSKIQGMIQIASQLYSSPKNILTEVNQWMYRSMDRQSFVTIVLGLIDIKKKSITICRAGHNPVIAVREGNICVIQCKGIGIGLTDSSAFTAHLEEYTRPLETGNHYVFYTDGVTEAMNANYEEYGEERLFEIIRKPWADSMQLLESVLQSVRDFKGEAEQHDDMTMVVIGYNEKDSA